MAEIILNQFESRQSMRRVEKRNGEIFVQCLGCREMKSKKKDFAPNHGMKLGVSCRCHACNNKATTDRKLRRKYRLAI